MSLVNTGVFLTPLALGYLVVQWLVKILVAPRGGELLSGKGGVGHSSALHLRRKLEVLQIWVPATAALVIGWWVKGVV